MTEPTWKRYLTDYNEGLGLVYERFVLNDFLLALRAGARHRDGARGAALWHGRRLGHQQRGPGPGRLRRDPGGRPRRAAGGVQRIWGELDLPAQFVHHADWAHLPFPDDTFDLAWNWAALWYLSGWRTGRPSRCSELVRVSRRRGLCGHAQPRAGGLPAAQVRAGARLCEPRGRRLGRHRPRAPRAGGGRAAHRAPGCAGRAALARHGHARLGGAANGWASGRKSWRASSAATPGSGAPWPTTWASSPTSTSG